VKLTHIAHLLVLKVLKAVSPEVPGYPVVRFSKSVSGATFDEMQDDAAARAEMFLAGEPYTFTITGISGGGEKGYVGTADIVYPYAENYGSGPNA
jgi:hypothetical protein